MLTFRVKFNLPSGLLDKATTQAEEAVAHQILSDTEPYVPALTGSLSERAYTDRGSVVYPGPYARYLYYGKLMIDPTTGSSFAPKGGTKVLTDKDLVFTKSMHGQAQDHWFEVSKAQNGDKWVKVAEKAVKKYFDK